MKHALGPLAVVRQQDEALRIAIEATDGVDPRAGRDDVPGHEIEDGPRGMGIADRGGHPGRLVDGEVDRARGPADGAAVDGDDGECRVDALAEDRDPTVDRHPPGNDELLARAARGDTGRREHFLEPLRGRR